MIHEALIPLAAGFLVGVNPFNAHHLRARLEETANPRRVIVEVAALVVPVTVLLVVVTWRFSAFISGRLTNSLLFLGFFVLAGAFYSLRPIRRRGKPDPPTTGWRWLTAYASDIAYYAGPTWIIATALAMKQITLGRFVLPFAAAAAGIVIATFLWSTRWARALPHAPPAPDARRTRARLLLSLAYGASGVLMLAANLKLL